MKRLTLTVAMLGLMAAQSSAAQILVNGGFETGDFTGWTVLNQTGSFDPSDWYIQTGTGSPLNGFPVPAPPEGLFAAMTDQGGPGSHVLYQDFVVPTNILTATLSFQRFISNQAGDFFTPDSLDYTVSPNQQARVDIITTTADPFSVAAGDVLLNIFQTMAGDPLVSGYTVDSTDLTAFLIANAGATLRLRFAEADNQLFFNFGVDDVLLDVTLVPEPSALALCGLGGVLGGLALRRRSRRIA
jgi:hypothetical protein